MSASFFAGSVVTTPSRRGEIAASRPPWATEHDTFGYIAPTAHLSAHDGQLHAQARLGRPGTPTAHMHNQQAPFSMPHAQSVDTFSFDVTAPQQQLSQPWQQSAALEGGLLSAANQLQAGRRPGVYTSKAAVSPASGILSQAPSPAQASTQVQASSHLNAMGGMYHDVSQQHDPGGSLGPMGQDRPSSRGDVAMTQRPSPSASAAASMTAGARKGSITAAAGGARGAAGLAGTGLATKISPGSGASHGSPAAAASRSASAPRPRSGIQTSAQGGASTARGAAAAVAGGRAPSAQMRAASLSTHGRMGTAVCTPAPAANPSMRQGAMPAGTSPGISSSGTRTTARAVSMNSRMERAEWDVLPDLASQRVSGEGEEEEEEGAGWHADGDIDAEGTRVRQCALGLLLCKL